MDLRRCQSKQKTNIAMLQYLQNIVKPQISLSLSLNLSISKERNETAAAFACSKANVKILSADVTQRACHKRKRIKSRRLKNKVQLAKFSSQVSCKVDVCLSCMPCFICLSGSSQSCWRISTSWWANPSKKTGRPMEDPWNRRPMEDPWKTSM